MALLLGFYPFKKLLTNIYVNDAYLQNQLSNIWANFSFELNCTKFLVNCHRCEPNACVSVAEMIVVLVQSLTIFNESRVQNYIEKFFFVQKNTQHLPFVKQTMVTR